MISKIKDKMPIWCKDKSKDIQLLRSDDTDALLCYIMQHYYFNRELHYFIDMSSERPIKGNMVNVTENNISMQMIKPTGINQIF